MLKRKEKEHLKRKTSDESSSEVGKKRLTLADSGDEAEKALERLVFGGESYVIDALKKEVVNEEDGFDSSDEEEEDVSRTEVKGHDEARSKGRQPVWVDDADEVERVDISADPLLRKLRSTEDETVVSGRKFSQKLKQQFEKIYGDGGWADLDRKTKNETDSEDDDDNDEDSILKRAGNLLTSKSDYLPQGFLDIRRVKDANKEKPSNEKGALQCVEFHPSAKVLLTAGFNKTLTLFQIDGQTNPKLQSIFINHFPISTAHFTADGEQVVLASERRFFYVYDLIKGDITKIPYIKGRGEKHFDKFHVSPDGKILVFVGMDGYLILLSSKTKQWIGNLKMNGSVRSVAFNADGSRMYSSGDDGEVYVWDMNTRSCVHKFRDEGCLTSTALAASRDGQYLSCGSDSGVVNIYDDQCLRVTEPKPLKAVMNLTTSVNQTLFNSTSEILAISSGVKRDCFKLIHLPSLTVFPNWPRPRTPLKYVNTFDFSPNSGYLSIGNSHGKALLYRLNHYTDS